MIQVEHLTRRYGEPVAVDDVSFHIDHGEMVEASIPAAESSHGNGEAEQALDEATSPDEAGFRGDL